MPSKPLRAIKPMFPSASSWKIVRGDVVQVMTGKDRGKQGEVLRVIRDQRFPRVFVSGVNMVTKRIRANRLPGGGIRHGFSVRMEAPIHYSNVMLLDPETKRPVRVTFSFEDQEDVGKRVRRTRGRLASNCVVPWPQKWKDDPAPNTNIGEKDTRPEDAEEVTYNAAADFTMRLPTAHRRLRELQQLRDVQAAAAGAARPQARRRGGVGGRSSRGFHSCSDAGELADALGRCSISAASSSSSSSSSSCAGAQLAQPPPQQQQHTSLPLLGGGRGLSALLACGGWLSSSSICSSRHHSSWCGSWAVAPLVLGSG